MLALKGFFALLPIVPAADAEPGGENPRVAGPAPAPHREGHSLRLPQLAGEPWITLSNRSNSDYPNSGPEPSNMLRNM
jgi:hypothetical protein